MRTKNVTPMTNPTINSFLQTLIPLSFSCQTGRLEKNTTLVFVTTLRINPSGSLPCYRVTVAGCTYTVRFGGLIRSEPFVPPSPPSPVPTSRRRRRLGSSPFSPPKNPPPPPSQARGAKPSLPPCGASGYRLRLPIDFLRVRCLTVAAISSPSPSHAELGSARSVPASGAHKHAVTKSPPSHCSLLYQACMTGGSLCLIFLYVVHCQSGLQLFLEAQTQGSHIDQPVSQSTINK